MMRRHSRAALKPADFEFLSSLGRRLVIEDPGYRQFLQGAGKGLPLATPSLRRAEPMTARQGINMF
ncbi:MAG: hypothetical protein ACREEJ_12155 [Ensifer adhaerens]